MLDRIEPAPGASPYVRQRVHDLLAQSVAYQSLPEDRRREVAADTEKVAQFIVGGSTGMNIPGGATLVGSPAAGRALADAPNDPAGQTAGGRFRDAGGANAAQTGSQAYTGMIREVNFPAFVAGLIDGVFNAIVTSSIKQMDAYAELVKNVAKSVDEFMKDNISENSARDYLADRYPDHLEVDIVRREAAAQAEGRLRRRRAAGLLQGPRARPAGRSLDEDTIEQVLVPAARKRMAMDRQQLLATMVLMGINRLVVTDGNIDASCTFSSTPRTR